MVKIINVEEHYCDCCGDKIQDDKEYIKYLDSCDNVVLPYLEERINEDITLYSYNYCTVEDMCDKCFRKLYEFTEDFTPIIKKTKEI